MDCFPSQCFSALKVTSLRVTTIQLKAYCDLAAERDKLNLCTGVNGHFTENKVQVTKDYSLEERSSLMSQRQLWKNLVLSWCVPPVL